MILADNDRRLALRLHTWNAAVAASLLPTLHIAEVAIRNFALKRLIAAYGKQWYRDPRLERRLKYSKIGTKLAEAVDNEIKAGRRGNLTDYITNELSFGFWVNIFTKTFYPDLWTRPIHQMSPHFPRGKTIEDLHQGVEFVRGFRNTVAHHKNVVRKPVVANYDRTIEVISWVCRPTMELASHTAQFKAIWACCPVPHERLIEQ